MKYIAALLVLLSNTSFGQSQNEMEVTKSFLLKNHIKLNTVSAPKGFSIYYNCDSMLFMRGDFNDTIKIWTPSIEEPQEIETFRETLKDKNYGITVFAKELAGDGRITVEYYHQTVFIFKNDSLFEIENTAHYPVDILSKNIKALVDSSITQAEFDKTQDSINEKFDTASVYKPKLIFTKRMFKGNIRKVRLSKKLNFMQDTIELENKWKEMGQTCYSVRINNEKENTSYAYVINDKMDFIRWQGCYLR